MFVDVYKNFMVILQKKIDECFFSEYTKNEIGNHFLWGRKKVKRGKPDL